MAARTSLRYGRNLASTCRRKLCTQANEINKVPLSKAVPGLPAAVYSSAAKADHGTTLVTKLDNGLVVASENKFGQFATVGVLTNSGSRYEVTHPSGITHFLEKLAFSSTHLYQRDEILQELEKHGGICDCQGSRDTLVHAISADHRGLEKVVDILSEVCLRPRLTEEELVSSRMAIAFELESIQMNPNPEQRLMEMVHAAAYRDNTLGLPKLCPADGVARVTRTRLLEYLRACHMPDRMVLAGVGMPHDELVDLAKQHFLSKTPTWLLPEEIKASAPESLAQPGPDTSIAQYTGGLVKVEADLSSVSLGPTPMPELAHVVVGLESCSHNDPDFIASCVLNMMMGGGGSFSAGGPGKGMYTRLYLNVLNRYHWIFNATAYNHSYVDSGLFCIHASSHPSQLRELVDVVLQEMANMAGPILTGELDRAKTQLQSMLLMNLESRPVVFEDIGRQVLATGERKPAKYYYDAIGSIKEADVVRVAKRLLRSKPSVAALGDLAHLPAYTHFQAALANYEARPLRKFSFFN